MDETVCAMENRLARGWRYYTLSRLTSRNSDTCFCKFTQIAIRVSVISLAVRFRLIMPKRLQKLCAGHLISREFVDVAKYGTAAGDYAQCAKHPQR